MPPPAQTIQYVLRGSSPGSEIWMTGFWTLRAVAVTSQSDLQNELNSNAGAVDTWWAAIKANIYNSFALNEIRAYYYDGQSNEAEFNAVSVRSGLVGGLTIASSPIDTSCCISLRTGLSGRSYRGRMYVPWHIVCNPANGLFNVAVSGLVTATGTMLSSFYGTTGSPPQVVSRKLGTSHTVHSVQSDQRPDVQRRRENRLPVGTISTATVSGL